jgi:predicted ATPase
MLTRIEVDGFKSLQNFSLDLEPFMAIVGVNGAGKSNLFDALALLSRLASMPVREALKAGRGHIRDQFSQIKDGHVTKMSFAAEFLLPPKEILPSGKEVEIKQTRVRYEVELERQVNSQNQLEEALITEEKFFPIRENDGWIQKHQQYKALAWYGENIVGTTIVPGWFFWTRDQGQRNFSHFLAVPPLEDMYRQQYLNQPNILNNFLSSIAVTLAARRVLQNFRFSQVEPNQLRFSSETGDSANLARDGSNLPTVFAALSPEIQGRVRSNLVRFVPGLRNVEVKQRDDEFYLEVTSSDGRRFPARILSDGTLRILALLTLLYSSPPGSLIAIEELENGIYPGRFVDLLETLVEATSPEDGGLQILLNSHSPTVIAALKDKPRALAFIDMVSQAGQRVTRVRQVQESPTDRGATSISQQEIAQILEVSQPESLL